jgi:SNF2 family DNA or RNA helicase|tara:strand:- start:17114 stop:18952 length:1839 start_codon:yes stop_codon:yes gene_type:complete
VGVFVELEGDKITIQAEWRLKEVCRALPGAKWDTNKDVWRIPLSWTGCLALRSTFKEQLEIGPALSEWATNEKTGRIDPANFLRDLENSETGDEDLFPHQRAGVDFLSKARRALLADEPGLGKTAQAIRTLKRLQEQGEDVFPALIVCPNTLKSNWKREFDRWWPGLDVQVLKGTPLQRRKAFETEAQVYIINWESLRTHSKLLSYGSIALARCSECGGHDSKVSTARCEVHQRELNKIPFKAVIADEIHRSKDPKSKQTRALWAASGSADIRFALTGTPIANTVVDLWPILHWLDDKEWPSKTKWLDRYVNTMLNAFGGLVILGLKPEMEAEFYAGIHPRMRRMLKARVLPWLPEIINDRRDVEMGAKQAKAYKQMLENMMAMLDSTPEYAFEEAQMDTGTVDGGVIVASNPLTQTGRLIQFASAYGTMEPTETGEKMILSDPSCKVDALMDDMKNGDFGEDSVAVCAVSRQLIELLSARFTKEGIRHGLITGAQSGDERQQAIDDFQAGKIKWILFTAQAGGVGVTLTTARRLVMLQRPWSLVDYKQALDRVHRIGSEIHDSVIITDYVTEGTIEERVIEALDVKSDNFEQIVKDKAKLMELLKDNRKAL